MRENVKNANNAVHLYGYVNDVRINDLESGRTAINLDVATLETYKNKEGKMEDRKSYHDVTIFTDDKKVIESFVAISDDVKANKENRGVEGYKPKGHTVSLDGILVQKENVIGGASYNTLQVVGRADSVKVDVPQVKEGPDREFRNVTVVTGNIGNIDMYDGFARLSVGHHYRPKGTDKEFQTWIPVRVNENRLPEVFKALKDGDLKKGDFIRMSGQLHNNNFGEDAKRRYTMVLDASDIAKIEKKEAKTEEVEIAPAPAETKEVQAAEAKATEGKKATGKKTPAKNVAAAKKTSVKKTTTPKLG